MQVEELVIRKEIEELRRTLGGAGGEATIDTLVESLVGAAAPGSSAAGLARLFWLRTRQQGGARSWHGRASGRTSSNSLCGEPSAGPLSGKSPFRGGCKAADNHQGVFLNGHGSTRKGNMTDLYPGALRAAPERIGAGGGRRARARLRRWQATHGRPRWRNQSH